MAGFQIRNFVKLKPVLLGVIFLIFSVMVGIFLYSETGNNTPENKPILSFPEATLSIGNIEHTATREGKTEWTLKAKSGQYLDENKKVIIKDLTISFYMEDETTVLLKAREGVLYSQTQNMEVFGNVVVENQGYRLKTEKMNYHHEKRIVYSDTPITIENNFLHLTADRFKLNLIENKTYLSGNVNGFLNGNL